MKISNPGDEPPLDVLEGTLELDVGVGVVVVVGGVVVTTFILPLTIFDPSLSPIAFTAVT